MGRDVGNGKIEGSRVERGEGRYVREKRRVDQSSRGEGGEWRKRKIVKEGDRKKEARTV